MTEPALSHLDEDYNASLHEACAVFIELCTLGDLLTDGAERNGGNGRIWRMRRAFEDVFPEHERDQARAVIAELLTTPGGGEPWAPQKYVP